MSYIRYDASFGSHAVRPAFFAPEIAPSPSSTMASSPSITSESPSAPSAGSVVHTPSFSPLYQQIKGLILQSLQAGEWRPGELIPSEMELAARFKVSQGTVRKAIDELAAENLVMRRQGKGTFVATHAAQQVQYRFLKLHPDTGDLQKEGRAQRSILECKRVRASAEVARLLQLKSGDAVIQARRVLTLSGTPTIVEDIWLPGQAFKGLTAEQMGSYQGPTYAMFELEFGVRMVRADEKIRAVLPDEEQARLLQVDLSTPLLSVERIAYTYNDIPMELRRGTYRTDTHHYRNELS